MQEINLLWIGGELSTMERISLLSHTAVGHIPYLWVYDQISVPEGTILRDASKILPKQDIFCYQIGEGAGSVSAFSNVFRYKLLLEHGGWWCDTDVVCLKSFNFDTEYIIASERTRLGIDVPTTCVIKCPSHSEAMDFCYQTSRDINPSNLNWGDIGPSLLQRAVDQFSLDRFVLPFYTICPVDWFASETDPVMHEIPDLMNSHAVHLWHEMWRRANVDKNKTYGPCLYEKLKSIVFRKLKHRKDKSRYSGDI